MSKKELKSQNKDLEFNVVDILSEFDPSETNKFTPFLVKMLRKGMDNHKPRGKSRHTGKVSNNVLIDNLLTIMVEVIGGSEQLNTIKEFHTHLNENRISENKRDINQYNSWDELQKEVNLANLKLQQKNLEKEVLKVLETEEWVVIRPLTLESSLTYGSGTKWCTSMKNNASYFYRYCYNGVLTYIINKLNGDKFGVMYDISGKDFSIWNAPDKRIDSVESGIPFEIMNQIYKMSLNEKSNYNYFSESEIKRATEYLGIKKSFGIENEPPQQPMMNMEEGVVGMEEEVMDEMVNDVQDLAVDYDGPGHINLADYVVRENNVMEFELRGNEDVDVQGMLYYDQSEAYEEPIVEGWDESSWDECDQEFVEEEIGTEEAVILRMINNDEDCTDQSN